MMVTKRLGAALAGATALAALLLASVLGTGPAEAAFPGQNGRIAFASNRDGGYEIYTMKPDGTGVRRLTDNGARFDDLAPDWSADGTKMVFSGRRAGGYYVFSMNADGSGKKRLFGCAVSGVECDPAISPDGTEIASWGYGDDQGGVDIIVTDADGTNRRVVAGGDNLGAGSSASHPAWSPDGSEITFSASTSSGPGIFEVRPDGTGLRKIPGTRGGGTDWRPDAGAIVFDEYDSRAATYDVFEVKPDGTGRTPIAADGMAPAYSPNGAKVAFYRDGDVWTTNRDGTARTNLTASPGSSDVDPDWGPRPVP